MSVRTKKFFKAFTVVIFMLVLIGSVSTLYADEETFEPTAPSGGSPNTEIVTATKNLWQTAAGVVQVLAIAAIVFAGLRYMFASADSKADIKKQLMILVIGAVLVFCSVSVATLIKGAGDAIL